jgi:putative N-acetyltransferase (TIGR04045 family)
MNATANLSQVTIHVRAAQLAHERAGHFAVRHEVFVRDQRLFAHTDVDEHDDHPSTVHLVGEVDGLIVGAVRIHETACPHRWQGDRLAVRRQHRASHLAIDLVQVAVGTAAALGGTVMEAHVQVPNVRFFEYLGWQKVGLREIYVGAPHQPMTFDLTSLVQGTGT